MTEQASRTGGLKRRRGIIATTLFVAIIALVVLGQATFAQTYPRCITGCTAKDVTLENVAVTTSGAGVPGEPINASIITTLNFNRVNSYCVRIVADVYIDGVLAYQDLVSQPYVFFMKGFYDLLLGDISWPYGSVLELRNIQIFWSVDNSLNDPSLCVGCEDYGPGSKCVGYASFEVTQPLVANFEGTPLLGCAPLDVQFTDLSSGGYSLSAYTYDWDFGDGSAHSTDENPLHTYTTPGTYTVTLTVTDANLETASETKTAYIEVVNCSTDLAISKSAPTTVSAGAAITYTLEIANLGPGDATNVLIADVLPAGLSNATYVITSGGSGSGSWNGSLTVGTLLNGASITLEITADVDLTATLLINQACVSSDKVDPDSSNNCDEITTVVQHNPAIVVAKSSSQPMAAAGDIIDYTVTVQHHNTSDGSPVNMASITDSLGVTLTGPSGDDGDGLLETSEIWIYTGSREVLGSDPDDLTNIACAYAVDLDGDPLSDCDSTTTTVVAGRLTITPGAAVNQVGAPHTFTITAYAEGSAPTSWNITSYDVTPAPSAEVLSGPVIAGDGLSATWELQINSTTPGVFAASAAVELGFGTTIVSVITDGVGGSSVPGLKTYIDVRLSLDPAAAVNQIGDDHVFTATLEYTTNGSTWLPLNGELIDFAITSGVGDLSAASATTNTNGQASITLASAVAGSTAVSASFDGIVVGADASANDSATKDWIDVRLSLDPAAATNQIGEDHTFIATLETTSNGTTWLPLSGKAIHFTIISGPGSLSAASATTNVSGQATVILSSDTVGTTAVSADFDGIAVGANAAAGDTASKDWIDVRLSLDPATATNQIGDDHVFTATLETTTDGSTWIPLSGATVDFNITSGPGSLSAASATTNGSGQATVTLSSSTVGTTAVSADFDGIAGGASATAGDTASKDWIDVRLSLDPATATNQIGDDHLFTATVEYTTNGSTWLPLSGATVNFAITSGPGSLSVASATTNGGGQATVTLSSDTVGTTAVSAGFDGIAAGASAHADDAASKDWIDVRVSLSPPSATNQVGYDHVFTARLEYTMDGSAWIPLNGKTISFGIVSGPGQLSTLSETTDVNGEALVILTSDVVGTTVLSGSFDGIAAEATATASNTATKSWIDVRLSLDPATAVNQIGDDHVFTATVEYTTDASTWLPLSGKAVDFDITSGPGSLSAASATTNSSGEATVTLSSSSVGTTAVSADFDGVAVGATATAGDTASKDWIDVRLSLDPATAINQIGDDHVFTATVEYTTNGSTWLPLSGVIVVFNITSGPGSVSAASATTNSSGEATVTLSSSIVGTTAVSANFDGVAVGATATAGDTASKDWIDVRLSLDPATATNQIGDDHLFTATVEYTTDGPTWLPLSGATVEFGITSGPGTLSAASATTNGSGEATVTLSSSTVGTTAVSANFDGIAVGASAMAGDTASKDWIDVRLSLDPATATNEIGDDHLFTATVEYTTNGSTWLPLSGATVNFAITSGPGSLSTPSATTNGSGEATVILSSNTVGTTAVSASFDGIAAGANATAGDTASKLWVRTDISIEKSITDVDGSGPTGLVDAAGDVISYQIAVSNDGTRDLTGINVSDPLLVALTGPTGDVGSDGILGVGETWIYTGTYTVLQSDIDSNGGGDGDIDNLATVSSNELPDESDSAAVPISVGPSYTIEKTVTDVAGAGPGGIVGQAGDNISYQIVVANTGNISLTGVGVSDSLVGLTGPSESISSNSVLDVGEIWTYTGIYTVLQADIDGNGIDSHGEPDADGDIDNTATVSSNQLPDQDDSEAVPLDRSPDYTIDKTVTDVAGDGPTGSVDQAGDVISYQIVVANTGNVSLAGVGVFDPLLGGLAGPSGDSGNDGVLGVNETWIYTGSYEALQSDIDNNGGGDGDIDNTATVFSAELADKYDSAAVQISAGPNYTIEKTILDVGGDGPAGSINQAGDVISYQMVVANTGNVSLTGILVSDPLLGALSGPTGDSGSDGILGVDEAWTFTGSYIVLQADLDNNGGGDGDVDNTATVSSNELPSESDSAAAPIAAGPSYTIEKTITDVDGAGPSGIVDQAGDVISYQIVVTNAGNVSMTGVKVSDNLIGLTGPSESVLSDSILNVGETWTYVGSYTVSQLDLDNNGGGDGDIDNAATVSSNELPDQSDFATVVLDRSPDYTIEKTVTDVAGNGPTGVVDQAGDIISYQIVVANTGNVSLAGTGAFDPLLGALSGPLGDSGSDGVLGVGETWIYTGSYTVVQSDIDDNGGGDGDIDNTATVFSDELPDESDSATVLLDQSPAYTIEKTAEIRGGGLTVDAAGDVIDYTIVVDNTGNQSLTNVNVSDSLIGLTGPVESLSSNGVLEVNETWTYVGSYTVLQADIDSNGIDSNGAPDADGDIDNSATVSSTELPEQEDSAFVPLDQLAGYTIEKTADIRDGEATVDQAGDIVDYTITVTNTGNQSLTGVGVSDSLISLVGPTESGSVDGILNVGEVWTYTGSYTVLQADIDNHGIDGHGEPDGDGDIDNTATVSSNELADQSDTAAVLVSSLPSYTISKTVTDVDNGGPAAVVDSAGDEIGYRIVVTNTGNVSLTSVSVSDGLIGLTGPAESVSVNGVLNVGETWTYIGSYTVLQADLDSNGGGDGDIDNTATVSSNELPDQQDVAAVLLNQSPGYTIEKTADIRDGGLSVNQAGDIVDYTIVVTNTGNLSLTGVDVSDSLISLAGPVESLLTDGVLNVGETWTYTGSYTVLQADLDSNGGGDGDIDNTATVSSNELPDEEGSAAVPLQQDAGYVVEKTAEIRDGELTVNQAGDIIDYTVVVSNTGNRSITGINVSDSLISLSGPSESVIANGILDVGEAWTYAGSYTVLQSDIDSDGIDRVGEPDADGDIDNTATVSSNELPNQEDSAQVPLSRDPSYAITKNVTSVDGAGNGLLDYAGEVIAYQIRVDNTGNTSITGISLSDPLLEGANGTLDAKSESLSIDNILEVGETWTYTGTYTVQQSDIDDNGGGDGDIDNTATVSSNELPDQDDFAVVQLTQSPDYTIEKSGEMRDGGLTVDQAGDIIDYTIVVTNTGNQSLTGVGVSDSRISLSGPAESVSSNGILNVSETWTYVGSYTVLQSDIDENGGGDADIDNTATVSSNELPDQEDSASMPLDQSPSYLIEKIAEIRDGGLTVDQEGDIIDYTIVVTNTGNQSLTGIALSDPLLEGASGTLEAKVESLGSNDILEVGETWTYAGTYTVLQADIDDNGGGDADIDNQATVSSNELPDQEDSATVPLDQSPGYTIEKTAEIRDGGLTIDEAGDIIDYTIVVTNTGNQSLTSVDVSDSRISLTGPTESVSANGILDVGETWTYTGSYTVLQGDIDSNGGGDADIDNIATVSSNELPSQEDSATVPLNQSPGYSIEKTAEIRDGGLTVDQAGDIIDYTIVVTNTGNQSLTGASVSDSLISLSGPTESVSSNSILDVGETWTYTGSYTVLQADIDNNGGGDGDIDNTATVSSNELPDQEHSATVPLNQSPGYAIEKTAEIRDGGLTIDQAGDIIDYTIIVTNTGNQSLTGAGVSDSLISLSGPAESISTNGILDVSETWTYTGNYTVLQTDIDDDGIDSIGEPDGDGDIDNTATVSSNELPDQEHSVAVPLDQSPGYVIEKNAEIRDGGLTIDQAGDIIDYTVIVANTGNQSLTGVNVSDNLISLSGPTESISPNGILDVGETWAYTGNYTVLQADIDSNGGGDGDIDNTATVSSNELPDQQDSAASPLLQDAGYLIEKTAEIRDGGLTIDQAGDIIDYTIVVTNTGNQSLTGVGVLDSLISLSGPTESVSPNGILDVGETWTITGSYTVLQADIDDNGGGDGDIDNTATVSSNELPDQEDSATALIDQSPGYSIEKSAEIRDGGLTIDQAGDIIDYTIVVTNTGNQSLTGVGVSDSLIGLIGPAESITVDAVLSVGEVWVYTGSYTVLQADIDSNGGGDGDIDNTATVSSIELPDQEHSVAVPLEQSPGYAIEKMAEIRDSGLTVDQAGDIIDYTIVVANTGNQSLNGVSVSDNLISLTGPTESLSSNGILDVGETWTYVGSYTVLQGDIDDNGGGDGDIDNTATVSSNELPDQEHSATVPLDLSPGYTIEKSAGIRDGGLTVDQAGDIVDYTIVVTNTGNQSLTGIGVSDSLIGLSGPTESVSLNGILDVGETWTYVGSYTVLQGDIDDNGDGDADIDNTATVSSNELADQEDSAAVPLLQEAGYAIEKSASLRDGGLTVDQAGDVVDYTIVVTNTGNQSLNGVGVSDSLISLIGPTESVSLDGILDVNETWTYTGSYTVLQTDIDGNGIDSNGAPDGDGDIDNTAIVSSNELPDQQDTANVPVTHAPSLVFEKTGDAGPVKVGESINYTLSVSNDGNVPLSNVTVVDALLGLNQQLGTIPPGDVRTINATYGPVPRTDLPGPLVNTAIADSDETNPQSDDHSVELLPLGVDLSLTKTVDKVSPEAGELVTFDIRLSNALGFEDATNVEVTDTLPSGFAFVGFSVTQGAYTYTGLTSLWDVGDLPAGSTATLTIFATALETGDHVSPAEVTAHDQDDVDSLPANANVQSEDDDDEAVVFIDTPIADLLVLKDVDNPQPAEGDQVTFTISVYNGGPYVSTGIVLEDTLPAGLGYVSDTSGGTYSPVSNAWDIGTLLVGQSVEFTITVLIDQGTAGTTITNTASILANEVPDPSPANNQASADVTVGEGGGGGGSSDECEGKVIISEIAWAGTAADPEHEWIELRNIGGEAVDLTGWVLRWRKKQPVTPEDFEWKTIQLSGELQASATPVCELAEREPEPAVEFIKREIDDLSWNVVARPVDFDESYMLLERKTDQAVSNVDADIVYDELAPHRMELSDEGDIVELLDADGEIADTANAFASYEGNWPAGDLITRGTMERIDPLGEDERDNWHTNLGIVTRGLDANGQPLIASSDVINSQTLEEMELFADLRPTTTLPGARLEVGLDLAREDRLTTGWPWIRITRPGVIASVESIGGGGGIEPVYSFASRYVNSTYWLGVDTAGLIPGDYLVWVVYGEGETVLVPITVVE